MFDVEPVDLLSTTNVLGSECKHMLGQNHDLYDEKTKVVIRSNKTKKDRQNNWQRKMDK